MWRLPRVDKAGCNAGVSLVLAIQHVVGTILSLAAVAAVHGQAQGAVIATVVRVIDDDTIRARIRAGRSDSVDSAPAPSGLKRRAPGVSTRAC